MAVDQFKRFLATALVLDCDSVMLSIISKMNLFDDRSGAAVNGDRRYGLSSEFSLSSQSEFHIWVKRLPDVPESCLTICQELTLYLAELNRTSIQIHHLLITKGSTELDWEHN
jgi:hypothetical protein